MQKKMKNQHFFYQGISLPFTLLVVCLLLALVLGVYLYWQSSQSLPIGSDVILSTSGKPSSQGQILEQINLLGIDEVKEYALGQVRFRVFPKVINQQEGQFSFGYFEAWQGEGKVFSSEPVYEIAELLSFYFKDRTYIIVSEYSGGAHCCFQEYIFSLNEAGDLKLIEALSLGNAHITKESLIEKSGNLYIKVKDDSLAYFYVPYAASYFFDQYFLLEGDTLNKANNNFKDDYVKEAERCANEFESKTANGSQDFTELFPLLTCRAANYLLAEQPDKAWQNFDQDFEQINTQGLELNSVKSIKQEIEESVLGLPQTEEPEEPEEPSAQEPVTLEELAGPIAEEILQALNQADYSKYSASFSPEMKEVTTEEVFSKIVEMVSQKIGQYVSKQATEAEKRGSYITVYYKAKFSKEPDDVIVKLVLQRIDDIIYVAGFWLDSPNLRQ